MGSPMQRSLPRIARGLFLSLRPGIVNDKQPASVAGRRRLLPCHLHARWLSLLVAQSERYVECQDLTSAATIECLHGLFKPGPVVRIQQIEYVRFRQRSARVREEFHAGIIHVPPLPVASDMRDSDRSPMESLDVKRMLGLKPVDRLTHLQAIRAVQLAQANFVFDHLPQIHQQLTLFAREAPRHRVHHT